MRFGPWISVAERAASAPEVAGVLQVRGDGLLAYPRGRSAMLLYAPSGPARTLRGFLGELPAADAAALERALALGARWIRFGASVTPEVDCARLLAQFTERFGAPPAAHDNGAGSDASEASGS